MSRFLRVFVCAFAVLALAGAIQAATVELGMIVDPFGGIWEVYAWASGGDNDGISGYNIEITNYIEGMQYMPLSSFGGIAFAGFTIGGKPIPDAEAGDALFAEMNSTNAASLWYGVGSPDVPSRIPGVTVDPPFEGQQVPWWEDPDIDTASFCYGVGDHFIIPGYGILVGEGTLENSSPGGWTDFGSSTSANVWEIGMAAINGTSAEAAEVITHRFVAIPIEPASFAILGIAFLGLLGLRRRGNR